ncbi:hypothetical protein [Persicobacter psychrovividus]|uniref:Uncharacterized protein n=1 Tax=Persicobacter psychrovividus TaxID=387638 RepID=A0ABN6LDU2_9BACT|nr:hypothetical protein PEPS_17670 [Persicobacter psychrovividus]
MFNSHSDSLVLGIGCYSYLELGDEFSKLNSKISFGHGSLNYRREGCWVDSIQISKNALNGISTRGMTLSPQTLILPENELNIAFYGETFRILTDNVYLEQSANQAIFNLNDGNGQYGDHQKVKELNLKIPPSNVIINIDLSQFPALKRLYIETEGTVNLDEELLNGIEKVEIKSDNLNK